LRGKGCVELHGWPRIVLRQNTWRVKGRSMC